MPELGPMSIRHDWSREEIAAIYRTPLNDLLFRAQSVHRVVFDQNRVQVSTLLSIKTGGCSEDCKYCPQSVRYHTGVDNEPLLDAETVLERARAAKAAGATRFCMGGAWRRPKDRDLEKILPVINEVKALGLETCLTVGMLNEQQAERLADAGLDYYNHNLDTSPEFYSEVITTRTYEDRLQTLAYVRGAGMKVCCGGIVGLGESVDDRVGLLHQLATLPEHPESVPINELVRVEGTPYADNAAVDPIEFVRTIATARILMPFAHVRLAAGRTGMSDELQALCFFAGANSIFYGEKLLTTPNPESVADKTLFTRLGIQPEDAHSTAAVE
ncbi:MAG: biotin synthase BioB [Gammaproteobacteria bacterium]